MKTTVTFIQNDRQLQFEGCPIPRKGEIVIIMGNELRENKINIKGRVEDI